ncbi:MAG: radical SAM protein [Oscillospiraceae bacterium]|jgi:histone acetyltransferase (RNA polymerase elongator complex component)|nr:radical SAM protein [Oscillospiraceae bacterium]
MKHSNISIFIPHIGCPHCCSFCNQHIISGEKHIPDIKSILDNVSLNGDETEIAFFGGSFTAIPNMMEYLEIVQLYLKQGYKGIRISTRPDCINEKILETLLSYNVTAIELGAQSFSDEVLTANERGHTSQDIVNASKLIKSYGFELGLQMMTSLYKSTKDLDLYTANEIIKLKPETVRIYPVVVLKGTKLAELFFKGEYKLCSFEECSELCADLLYDFHKEDIKVIKCGLHASEFVKSEMVAGFYHPAFRELAEGRVYKKLIRKPGIFAIGEKCLSKAIGHGNKSYFKELGADIVTSKDLGIFEIIQQSVT